MSQHVVQIEDPKNRGEREMLNFLTRLPEEEYLVFQELKLDSSFHQKTKGLKQRQPDFVVVGRDTGVLSIEVKDWNLVENQYVWRDQREIKKIDRHGNDVILDNPVHQAQTYRYALEDLLDDLHERPGSPRWLLSRGSRGRSFAIKSKTRRFSTVLSPDSISIRTGRFSKMG